MKKTFKDAQLQGIRLGNDVIVTSDAGAGQGTSSGNGQSLDDIPEEGNTGNNG